MKKYCPGCESPLFPDWYDDHEEEWCKCPECGEEGPAEDFPGTLASDYWQNIDDWVHEYINEHWTNG